MGSRFQTGCVLIIILVAVLSTPLTLKKLIDQTNRRKAELLGDSSSQLDDGDSQTDSNAPSSKTYKTYDDEDDWPNNDD